ncbi:hypothetical protein [Priestia megaterium]|uniref:hypothetical protein n=1 Tax=Priestia megaterium TaxID=1404 RepID=UPI0032D9442C
MEPVKYLKDMLGVVEGTAVDTVIDGAAGVVPVVGKVYQMYQMNKLQRRMNAHEKQLNILKDKIELSENEVFYKQEVFPLIVKHLMDEDEDAKSKIIIDGFEYTIDNDLKEIERVYHYYDVLSDLRYSDIMVFVDTYMPYHMRKNKGLKFNFPSLEEMQSSEFKKKQAMNKIINTYQTNKLLRLGLIESHITTIDAGGFTEDDKGGVEQETKITEFGVQFLKFFSIEDE